MAIREAAQRTESFVEYREPLRILPLVPEVEVAWDDFVRSHPAGTFFHQTGWKRVIEKTYGYRPVYFYTERAGRITGIAPSFLVSNWLTGECLISLPFAVYGGVCAADAESEQALIGQLQQVAAKNKVEYLELRNRKRDLLPGYQLNSRYVTFSIEITTNTEALYKAFPKDIRYMIRKGEKAGLRCQHGLDQVSDFYQLLTINLRRLGTPAFPRSLFDNIIHEFPGQVEVTLLYLKGEALAGGMSFFFRDWIQPYYIGSTDLAKTLAANNLLWWELIKLGAERGCRTFDFGRSKRESGNFDFKKKWNPQIESLDYQVRLVQRREMPNFSPANPKFELATTLWKKMPLGLTQVLGPRIVRWFP